MPRPERPVDPEGGVVARFAIGLRELRRIAGSPGYRELAQRAHYSPTTLSQAARGEILPSLPVTLAYVRGCGGDVEVGERRGRAAPAALDVEPSPAEADDVASRGDAPYVGLAAYGPEDADWFHGRERVVDELVTRVHAHRFVTVLGPSGTGKTSMLRAGLLPRLTAEGSIRPVVFTPGAHPLEECAIHLARLLDSTPGSAAAELAEARGLHRLVRQALVDRPSGVEVVLVIDQFEEVFTLCRDAEERSRFVSALVAAGRSDNSRCRIVLSVRADFYPHCLLDAELATVLNGGQLAVGPMTVDELRQVIVRPARRAGCMVEGSLLAALVAHAHGRAGALPLLSHALLETWRRRSGNTLTLAAFERAGGIDGALAKTAEAVFVSLTEDQQAAARRLFLRLVALGEGTPDTKRRVAMRELDDDAAILTAFSDTRLVVLSEHGVEITHEALIGAWPRLRSWLADDREGQRIHRKLTEATATWQEHDRDPGALLRGTPLAVVADWARLHRGAASHAEAAFLEASARAEGLERAAVRRRTRVLRELVVLLAVLVVITTTTAIHAMRAQESAARQGDVAIALNAIREAESLVDTKPELAAQISLAAHRLYPSSATANSLITHAAAATALPLPASGAHVSVSPDGRNSAVNKVDEDRTALFDNRWRSDTAVLYAPGGRFPPRFSPDGRMLLTVDKDAVLHLRDMRSPGGLGDPLTLPTKSMEGTFSPDSELLVTTDATLARSDPEQGDAQAWSEGTTTRVWSVADGGPPRLLTILPNTTSTVTAFAAHSRVMAAVSRNGPTSRTQLALWDLTEPAAPKLTKYIDVPQDVTPTSATFAHDDRILYVGDSSGAITAWHVGVSGKPENVAEIDGNGSPVEELVASHDGRTLASSDIAGQLTVWNIATSWELLASVQSAREAGIVDIAFAADGRTLLGVVMATAPEKPRFVQWHLNVTGAARSLCGSSPARITQTEWNTYLAGSEYQPPCA